MANYCTLDELKAQIEKTGADNDAILSAIIGAASEAIDRFCNRQDGFIAEETASARRYTGSGSAIQLIDECIGITLVEVKDSPSDDDYVSWAPSDWISFRGDKRHPDYNHTPYTKLMVDPTGDETYFTGGAYVGRAGFRPTSEERRGVPTVRVTARWGYADVVPAQIKQAAITQTARWYKRGQSSWADTLASGEFGMLMFKKPLDPDVQFILVSGRFVRPSIG